MDSALEFEIAETIAIRCRLRQPHHAFRVHRFLMTQLQPGITTRVARLIVHAGQVTVGDIEQIAEDRHPIALFAAGK